MSEGMSGFGLKGLMRVRPPSIRQIIQQEKTGNFISYNVVARNMMYAAFRP